MRKKVTKVLKMLSSNFLNFSKV